MLLEISWCSVSCWYLVAAVVSYVTAHIIQVVFDLPMVKGQKVPDSPSDQHFELRKMLQRILEEVTKLPELLNHSGLPLRPEEHLPYFSPKKYEQLLATAVLNKVVENYRNPKNFEGVQQDVVDKAGPPTTGSTPAGSAPATGTTFDINHNKVTGKSLLNEVNLRQMSLENELKEDLYGRSLSESDESYLSDYIQKHTVPLPDLSDTTGSGSGPEDDVLSLKSNATDGTWEENWLFKKRQLKTTESSIAMLVPSPTEEVKALIGDKNADEVSDLSEAGSDVEDYDSDSNTKNTATAPSTSTRNTECSVEDHVQDSLVSINSIASNEPVLSEAKNDLLVKESSASAENQSHLVDDLISIEPSTERTEAANPTFLASNDSFLSEENNNTVEADKVETDDVKLMQERILNAPKQRDDDGTVLYPIEVARNIPADSQSAECYRKEVPVDRAHTNTTHNTKHDVEIEQPSNTSSHKLSLRINNPNPTNSESRSPAASIQLHNTIQTPPEPSPEHILTPRPITLTITEIFDQSMKPQLKPISEDDLESMASTAFRSILSPSDSITTVDESEYKSASLEESETTAAAAGAETDTSLMLDSLPSQQSLDSSAESSRHYREEEFNSIGIHGDESKPSLDLLELNDSSTGAVYVCDKNHLEFAEQLKEMRQQQQQESDEKDSALTIDKNEKICLGQEIVAFNKNAPSPEQMSEPVQSTSGIEEISLKRDSLETSKATVHQALLEEVDEIVGRKDTNETVSIPTVQSSEIVDNTKVIAEPLVLEDPDVDKFEQLTESSPSIDGNQMDVDSLELKSEETIEPVEAKQSVLQEPNLNTICTDDRTAENAPQTPLLAPVALSSNAMLDEGGFTLKETEIQSNSELSTPDSVNSIQEDNTSEMAKEDSETTKLNNTKLQPEETISEDVQMESIQSTSHEENTVKEICTGNQKIENTLQTPLSSAVDEKAETKEGEVQSDSELNTLNLATNIEEENASENFRESPEITELDEVNFQPEATVLKDVQIESKQPASHETNTLNDVCTDNQAAENVSQIHLLDAVVLPSDAVTDQSTAESEESEGQIHSNLSTPNSVGSIEQDNTSKMVVEDPEFIKSEETRPEVLLPSDTLTDETGAQFKDAEEQSTCDLSTPKSIENIEPGNTFETVVKNLEITKSEENKAEVVLPSNTLTDETSAQSKDAEEQSTCDLSTSKSIENIEQENTSETVVEDLEITEEETKAEIVLPSDTLTDETSAQFKDAEDQSTCDSSTSKSIENIEQKNTSETIVEDLEITKVETKAEVLLPSDTLTNEKSAQFKNAEDQNTRDLSTLKSIDNFEQECTSKTVVEDPDMAKLDEIEPGIALSSNVLTDETSAPKSDEKIEQKSTSEIVQDDPNIIKSDETVSQQEEIIFNHAIEIDAVELDHNLQNAMNNRSKSLTETDECNSSIIESLEAQQQHVLNDVAIKTPVNESDVVNALLPTTFEEHDKETSDKSPDSSNCMVQGENDKRSLDDQSYDVTSGSIAENVGPSVPVQIHLEDNNSAAETFEETIKAEDSTCSNESVVKDVDQHSLIKNLGSSTSVEEPSKTDSIDEQPLEASNTVEIVPGIAESSNESGIDLLKSSDGLTYNSGSSSPIDTSTEAVAGSVDIPSSPENSHLVADSYSADDQLLSFNRTPPPTPIAVVTEQMRQYCEELKGILYPRSKTPEPPPLTETTPIPEPETETAEDVEALQFFLGELTKANEDPSQSEIKPCKDHPIVVISAEEIGVVISDTLPSPLEEHELKTALYNQSLRNIDYVEQNEPVEEAFECLMTENVQHASPRDIVTIIPSVEEHAVQEPIIVEHTPTPEPIAIQVYERQITAMVEELQDSESLENETFPPPPPEMLQALDESMTDPSDSEVSSLSISLPTVCVSINTNSSTNLTDADTTNLCPSDQHASAPPSFISEASIPIEEPVSSESSPIPAQSEREDKQMSDELSNGHLKTATNGGSDDSGEDEKLIPGSIAEREHLKWRNASPIANNPYSPDVLQKRLSTSSKRSSLQDFDRLVAGRDLVSPTMDIPVEVEPIAKDEDEVPDKDRSLQTMLGGNPSQYKRYGRDYYINDAKRSSGSRKEGSDIPTQLTHSTDDEKEQPPSPAHSSHNESAPTGAFPFVKSSSLGNVIRTNQTEDIFTAARPIEVTPEDPILKKGTKVECLSTPGREVYLVPADEPVTPRSLGSSSELSMTSRADESLTFSEDSDVTRIYEIGTCETKLVQGDAIGGERESTTPTNKVINLFSEEPAVNKMSNLELDELTEEILEIIPQISSPAVPEEPESVVEAPFSDSTIDRSHLLRPSLVQGKPLSPDTIKFFSPKKPFSATSTLSQSTTEIRDLPHHPLSHYHSSLHIDFPASKNAPVHHDFIIEKEVMEVLPSVKELAKCYSASQQDVNAVPKPIHRPKDFIRQSSDMLHEEDQTETRSGMPHVENKNRRMYYSTSNINAAEEIREIRRLNLDSYNRPTFVPMAPGHSITARSLSKHIRDELKINATDDHKVQGGGHTSPERPSSPVPVPGQLRNSIQFFESLKNK